MLNGLGGIPPSSAFSWLPVISMNNPTPLPTTQLVSAPLGSTIPNLTQPSLCGVPAGSYLGEGLLPVPDKLVQKILKLEFVEMRDLMPESWMREEEEATKPILTMPRRKLAPVTDVLLWLQCYAALVGVLSKGYPTMVPEFMSYQAMIIKCSRDFQGPAWAQYDRAYRRQVAQTKDLRWSRLNPTLYSLCFAGKAKRHVVCATCLSDTHATEHCPETLQYNGVFWPGQINPMIGQPSPAAVPPPAATGGAKLKLCNLFNAPDGSRCHYNPCKFTHRCSVCKGAHPRSSCRRASGGEGRDATDGGRLFKRPRAE